MDREQAIEKIVKELEKQTVVSVNFPIGADPSDFPINEHLKEQAANILNLMESLGYRLIPELKVPEVPNHSVSIGCPHCGGEFGIESFIEIAYEAQRDYDLRQIKGEKEVK